MMPPHLEKDTILLDNMEGACSASAPSAVLARCHWDVQRCDAVLANMLGADVASVGTAMELAWAVAYNKPIIVVDNPGSPHDHCMIRSATPYFYSSLDEAIEVLWKLLT
jgi:nucleoside 2-deoxyribosyltransferase